MRTVVAMLSVTALLLVGAPSPAVAVSHACPDPTRLPPTPFRDVEETVHRSAVICADWYGIVNGTRWDAFSPRRSVRRDQMAAYLARLFAAADRPLPVEPPIPFSDVGDSTHRDAIALVATIGVVDTPDDRFRPRERATRGEVVEWLIRLAARMDVTASDPPDAFGDDDGSPTEDAINTAVALGLVRGRADGTFGVDEHVRRDQAAGLLARLIRVLVDRAVLAERRIPTFSAPRTAIPADMRRRMRATTWRPGCPVPLADLVLLRPLYWDFAADARRGRLIVARAVAADVSSVFARLYTARFQIRRMRPVHTFARGEAGSLDANNTSAFNCRTVTGGSGWSQHSYGTAIDINPRQNPYVQGSTVLPANGRPWVRRTPVRRGMITATGPVVAAFDAVAWGWGGRWRTLKDYQHFSAAGR